MFQRRHRYMRRLPEYSTIVALAFLQLPLSYCAFQGAAAAFFCVADGRSPWLGFCPLCIMQVIEQLMPCSQMPPKKADGLKVICMGFLLLVHASHCAQPTDQRQ